MNLPRFIAFLRSEPHPFVVRLRPITGRAPLAAMADVLTIALGIAVALELGRAGLSEYLAAGIPVAGVLAALRPKLRGALLIAQLCLLHGILTDVPWAWWLPHVLLLILPLRSDVPSGARRLLLFDADCGFCKWAVSKLQPLTPRWAKVTYQSLQESRMEPELAPMLDESRAGLHIHLLELDGEGRPVARMLGFYAYRAVAWKAIPIIAWALWLPLVPTLGQRAYLIVARNRHALPGGTATCALPPARPSDTR